MADKSSEQSNSEKTMQDILTSGLRKLLGRDFILLALLVSCVVLVVLKGKDALAQQVDAGMEPFKAEQVRQAAEIERLKASQNEVQTDIRALYKAVMTGQKQERLEKPAVQDGGQ